MQILIHKLLVLIKFNKKQPQPYMWNMEGKKSQKKIIYQFWFELLSYHTSLWDEITEFIVSFFRWQIEILCLRLIFLSKIHSYNQLTVSFQPNDKNNFVDLIRNTSASTILLCHCQPLNMKELKRDGYQSICWRQIIRCKFCLFEKYQMVSFAQLLSWM